MSIADVQQEIAALNPAGDAQELDSQARYPETRLPGSSHPVTLDDVKRECEDYGTHDPVWHDKMWHRIPKTKVVDRVKFILERARGKVVLDCGCTSGGLHTQLRRVSKKVYGIDRDPCDAPDTAIFNFEDCARREMPRFPDVELVIVAELLEHLSNPGHFLDDLWAHNSPILITVPNCGGNDFRAGIECVNRDHVAWYSWKTLSTLLGRHGWPVKEFYWYNGTPGNAEGLVVVAEHV